MRRGVWTFLLVAVVVALFLSPFASPFPDGLEKVAFDIGFLERGEGKAVIQSPIPDYTFPGISNEKVATSVAGVVGTLLTFGVMYGVALMIRSSRSGHEGGACSENSSNGSIS